MSARRVDPRHDPAEPGPTRTVRISFDGDAVEGVLGQSIAGILMGADRLDWRTTSREQRPRGLFCGIGVCFDCVVSVDGQRDVRACQRIARGGEVVERQSDALPRPAGGGDA